jgi:hypothetical protein
MTTLSVGALCTVRQTGSVLYVAKQSLPDNRWRLTAKQVDARGRVAYQTRDAGIGDITVIRDAATYQVGSTINWAGLEHVVLEDRADNVQLGVPEHGRQTRGGDVIRIPRTNVREVSKADLALATMGGKAKKKEKDR